MWYCHIYGHVHKVGTSKDDLLDWMWGGYSSENYAWGYTKNEAIKEAKALFGDDWICTGEQE